MTLIVLSVSLTCHARDFRFDSVRIWLAFGEDYRGNPTNKEAAAPEVIAYAPFVAPQNWSPSDEAIEKTAHKTTALGAEKFIKADIGVEKEDKRSFTRTHFDRGSADWILNQDQKPCGVNWYCEQNDLQK